MSKLSRHLVTTGDPRTVILNHPVLLLGEWCNKYRLNDIYTNIDSITMPHHWLDEHKFNKDFNYLDGLYERLLSDLAFKLNEIHDVKNNLLYWRVLVGPWLGIFLQILFDRWSLIKKAENEYELAATTIINLSENSVVPKNMQHFISLFSSDEWNHYIFSKVLENSTDLNLAYISSSSVFDAENKSSRETIKIKVLRFLSHIASALARKDDIFFFNSYLPKYYEMKLQLRFGQFPQFWQMVEPTVVGVDLKWRNWKLDSNASDDFESFAISMIAQQIPTSFLEGYNTLVSQSFSLKWPKTPKAIFSSNILWTDTLCLAYVAKQVSSSVHLIYGQHGGGYGISKHEWAEKHELKIADKYLSWGWADDSYRNITSVGILKLPGKDLIQKKSNCKKSLLLVTLESVMYPHRLSSESIFMSNSYIDSCLEFANNLKFSLRDSLVVRLSPYDHGWGQAHRWRLNNPKIRLDLGEANILDLLCKARIAVFTYNQTGYLESMTLNVPTVLFWDSNKSPIRNSAKFYFKELQRVGIYHTNPKSAALHIANVWDDVDAWWGSEEVQDVIASFKKQYCNQSENILDKIESVIRDLITESSSKKSFEM